MLASDSAATSTLHVADFSRENWDLLRRGELLAVRIPGFATPEECEALVRAAEEKAFDQYENVDPPIDRIGCTVFEHDGRNQAPYFEKAQRFSDIQRSIFDASFDPLSRLFEVFQDEAGLKAARAADPEHGEYYAGLIRRIEGGTLVHVDYAPGEHSHWMVTGVKQQLAWNLYVELRNTAGGQTRVWDKFWEREHDAAYKIPGTYGYDESIVQGVPFVEYAPTLGDVYIINTKAYHTVVPCNGRRTAVTSAIGVMPDDESIVLWS